MLRDLNVADLGCKISVAEKTWPVLNMEKIDVVVVLVKLPYGISTSDFIQSLFAKNLFGRRFARNKLLQLLIRNLLNFAEKT